MMPCSYSDFLRVSRTPNGLSIALLTLAIKNIKCKIAFYVYLLLLELTTENREVHTVSVAQQTIAKHLNVNTRTVKRAIAFLTNAGYLIVTRDHPKKGGYQLNKIQVRFPEPLVQILLNKLSVPTFYAKEHHNVQPSL